MSKDICDRFAAYLKGKEVRELSDHSISRYHARKAKSASSDAKDSSLIEAHKNRRSLIGEVRQAVNSDARA
jgi:hypothetical protein